MDPDSWTAARGWKIALAKAGKRAGIVSIVLTGVLYLAWGEIVVTPASAPGIPLGTRTYEWFGPAFALLLFVGAVVGWPVGFAVARKLVDDSGLEGRRLLLPVVGIVLAAELLACCLVSLLRGGSMLGLALPLLGLFLWSAVGCVLTLLFK